MQKSSINIQKAYQIVSLSLMMIFAYNFPSLGGRVDELWKDESLFHQSVVNLSSKIPFGKSEAYPFIVKNVQKNPIVKSLNLSKNHLQQEDLDALTPILSGPCLETIILNQCDIGSEGAIGLLKALKGNSSLTHLDLSSNGIEGYGIAKIDESLKDLKNLRVLNISHNPIGSRVAPQLSSLLALGLPIEELNLEDTNLNDRGLHTIVQEIAHHQRLKVLSLSENPFGDLGATSLDYMLSKNTSLKKLSIKNCNLSDDGLQKIKSGLNDNRTLEWLELAQEQPFSISILDGELSRCGFSFDNEQNVLYRGSKSN